MFRKEKLIIALVLIFLMAAFLIGCAPPDETAGEVEDGAAAVPEETVKIAISSFLSGPASAPFGIPGRNAADVLVEHLNEGTALPPYDTPGIGGRPIELVVIDEAGGAEVQVAEYRRLVLDEKVDVVIGYISSADALAIAPVADELETLTIIYDAGTHQLFEDADYKYVFRTKGHQIIDNVAAARYVLDMNPNLKTIAGINQDYAWGHDCWEGFREAILALKPDVEVVGELFPALYAGDYSAEISSLLAAKPDVIHTSLWGGDMEGYFLQGLARGLHEKSTLVFTPGDTMLPRQGDLVPPGIIILGRGPHGAFGPRHEMDEWFIKIYKERFGDRPVYPSYHMTQAILGVKAAYERALEANNGEWPTTDEIIEHFKYLEFDTPSGIISMGIGGGHQGVEPCPVGITGEFDPETGEVKIENIIEYPVEEVNPPDGIKSFDWIKGDFEIP